ncbi:HlyD family efflux transporter periplasmic adaptor subunit [Anabaena cylindrica FACHB-243]|uniref:Secretion protein HlyD family protein n=1 Tax=Anabaena cylindrica (strain ATCC 27899 / PCC 7122) TaxID=272123 RepID=K9ZBV0_ANACC|nr:MULTISPECIES: HlyD family efflux transporter periplasmic adaptor subunit [Anabaena]AFZ56092.1 secretion protein HlyD family protein [Anabaena cylindrica PCC 7122]MBD2419682.1 HlyD family efflux transporter periplasmic adaptor subunit [Anabaena cylindrica FACHB-243]MBY5285422.1 HlyD family efflux transporter periplasmic adaptor subunit [Anabaena sp. CCAP 1446/1C]MBY5310851.1 HlyD family efflux transporter periplasmic adaptor subunit [Anabaena sp. CCAP 1446/1C]MCM2408308.1 HlyD family secreti
MTLLNGHHVNGNGNGNGNGKKQDSQVLTLPKKAAKNSLITPYQDSFEQSVVLRQSPIWSRTIMITLMGLACFGIAWANFAKIEQVVPATGQLKPEGTVKEVQAPISGVVKSVYVKDGQEVKPGDLLLTFDSIATLAELSSLNKIRVALTKENDIYRRLMGASTGTASELDFLRSRLPAESAFLLKSRASLVAENELLRSQLKNLGTESGNGIDEQQRLIAAKTELDSRSAAANLEVEKTRKQLSQTLLKRQDTQNSLAIQEGILSKLKILAEEGGISQLQYLNQQQQVQTLKAEVAQLFEEEKRLQLDIQKRQQEVTNTVAFSDKSILDKIADNKKRIAEVDSQFMRIILDNEQRLADITSKISQTQLNVRYQELRAPVAGIVFDMQAKNPGFVANPTQKLLQIVPNDKYVADVFITNKDIGFVRKGMKVDVRIDSFPFSQFGDIKGEIIDIGSDALPPDQTHQFYRFPATISLDKQYLEMTGKNISLQSGMSITANIKVREERTVMSLFTEMFTKQVESLKEVR